MSRNLTTTDFIKRGINIHGNKYDYKLVEYTTSRNKIKILCKKHGEFLQLPSVHLLGKGCYMCGREKIIKNNESTTKEFIKSACKVHGNRYGYNKTNYLNNKTKVLITCKKHGDFLQTPKNHLQKAGCMKCSKDVRSKNQSIIIENFIDRAKIIHNNIYEYKFNNIINCKTKVLITCKKHGDFLQTPNGHLKGQGCPICKESNGEKKINEYLTNNNCIFEREKKFDTCRNILPLPFDFYLPKQNLLIEFDGRQHFESIKFFGGEKRFSRIKHSDKIKNEFAKNNDIKLLRISYESYNDIFNILKKNIYGYAENTNNKTL